MKLVHSQQYFCVFAVLIAQKQKTKTAGLMFSGLGQVFFAALGLDFQALV